MPDETSPSFGGSLTPKQVVRFTRHTRVGNTLFNKGETAGFSLDEARRLVRNNHAAYVGQAPKEPDPVLALEDAVGVSEGGYSTTEDVPSRKKGRG